MVTLNLDAEHWELVSENEESTPDLQHLQMVHLMMQLASQEVKPNLTTEQLLEEF